MTSPADSDAALMLKVQRGDLAAFESLVEKYRQPVFSLIQRMLNDAAEAEDLTQNVFVQAFKAAYRYRVSAKFSTWLFTIARNLALNEIRRRGRHAAAPLEKDPAQEGPAGFRQLEDTRSDQAPDALLRDELRDKVEEAIARLPVNQKAAILLWKEEELCYEDIAKVLGCSVSAVKSLLHRARETLKQQLKPYLKTGIWRPSA